MKQLNDCIDKGSNTHFSRTEKGKTFSLQSDKQFECKIVDVDHCVFKNVDVRRCDWLFLVPKKDTIIKQSKAYYIELKGINIDDACEQLYHAIDRTKSQIPNLEIEARVVSIKGMQPEIMNSGYYKKVRKIIRKDIGFCKVHRQNKFTHIETI